MRPMANILIVEDDDAVRGILLDLLSERYACDAAGTADEAFHQLEIEKYDAVLADSATPGLSSIEFIQRMQLQDLKTPVIFISGNGAGQDPQTLIDLGAFACVTKPFSLEEIEFLVARAVEAKSPLQREEPVVPV